MTKLLLLFPILLVSLLGAEISGYNILERDGRVDVMLTFDSPFNGTIAKQTGKGYVNLLLSDAYIKEDIERAFSDKTIDTLKIYQDGPNVNMLAGTDYPVSIIASKTAENYGLRIRFTPKNTTPLAKMKDADIADQGTQNTLLSSITKQDSIDYKNYLLVIGILLIMVVVLLYVRKKLPGTGKTSIAPAAIKGNWLFGRDYKKEDVKIISQKHIDPKNKIVIADIYKTRYIMLVGQNSSTLIDTIGHDGKKSEQTEEKTQFDSILNQKRETLEDFLELEDKKLEELKRQAGRDLNLFS